MGEDVTRVKTERTRLIWWVVFLLLAGCAPSRIARVELPTVEERGTKPLMLRVNIVDGVSHVTISSKGACRVFMGSKATTSPAGKEWLVKLVNGEKIIETRSSQARVIKDPEFPLVFSQKVAGGFITVNGLPYRGSISVRRVGRDQLLVINEVSMEEYLRSVVPSELGNGHGSPLEAVKAQAVAARTYAVANLGKRDAFGYDLVAGTGDQVYSGVIRESDLTDKAVRETQGVIAMYRGKPINAVYHSTCGGHTCSNEYAWMGDPVPYLRGRPDVITSILGSEEPLCGQSPMYAWTRSWTSSEFSEMIETNLKAILGYIPKGSMVSVSVVRRDKYGRAVSAEVKTTESSYRVEKGNIRSLFSDPRRGWVMLPSNSFELTSDGSTYTMNGKGWGHGVGMCQWGAIGMAKRGQSYESILRHYYKSVYLAKAY